MTNSDVKKFVSRKIKEYRKLHHLTQKELGDKIGVKFNTISGYENGTNEAKQDILFKIANALDISINDLFPSTKNISNSYESNIIYDKSYNNITVDEKELLYSYRQLNSAGKSVARSVVDGLTSQDQYMSKIKTDVII